MSIITRNFGKAAVASLGVAAVLFTGLAPAAADPWWGHGRGHDRDWRHDDDWRREKVIVVHRHERRPPVRVIHVYRDDDNDWRPRRVERVRVVERERYRSSGPDYSMSNQTGGMILGGIIGAVTGAQIGKGTGKLVAVASGTVIGALIGGSVGQSMDRVDRMQVQQSMETAPTGTAVSWKNPDTGNRYTVTPTRTYSANGQPCRDYDAWVMMGGYEQKVTGTACRMADGSWQTVSN